MKVRSTEKYLSIIFQIKSTLRPILLKKGCMYKQITIHTGRGNQKMAEHTLDLISRLL